MGKKKKSGRKDHSTTEKIILVTAIIQLIELLIEVIKELAE